MANINKNIQKQLAQYDSPIDGIAQAIVEFAQNMPEDATREELDRLIRKAVKREEKK